MSTAARSSTCSTSSPPFPGAPTISTGVSANTSFAWIERLERGARDTAALQIGEREREGTVGAACEHERDARNVAIGHRELLSREVPAFDAGADARGIEVARTLGDGERADELARSETRKELLLLLRAPGQQQRLGREIDGRGERNRSQRAADLLGDQHQLEVAKASAAEFFRHGGSEPAHLADALPERGVVEILALEHAAAARQRRVLHEVIAGRLLDQLLVLGEVEVHRGLLCD
jgi:hypothetical protein